jgi:hypothetical protein
LQRPIAGRLVAAPRQYFGRRDRGAERRSRKRDRRAPQRLDCPRRHGGAVTLLASAPRLPLGDGVAGIAVTSVAAKMSRIVAGVVAFGDPLGGDLLAVGADYGVPPRARGRGFDAWARARAGEGSRNRGAEPVGPAPSPA